MPTAQQVRAQVNAAIKTVSREISQATSQAAKNTLKQSLRELIQLRAQVARAQIASNSEALRQLKQRLDAAVTRARQAQLSHTVGRIGQIADAVDTIVSGGSGTGTTTTGTTTGTTTTPPDTTADTSTTPSTDTTTSTPPDTTSTPPTDTTTTPPTDVTDTTSTDTTSADTTPTDTTPADDTSTTTGDTAATTPTDTTTDAVVVDDDDDRLTQPPAVDGLPPPDADEPDDTVSAASTEEYWYADEREDLLAAATDRLTDPPPPSDPTEHPQWAVDAWSPDYSHLARPPSDEPFRFAGADLALLCELNSFDVDFGQDEVLFGLRGCTIAGGTGGTLRPEVLLQEAVPNHRDLRCVIGVWKRSTGQVAVFNGSTVPNPTGMKRQFAFGNTERRCNMLPTGRYKYIVGNHKAVPNAFRLEQEVMVIRSHDDLMYEISDFWDRCTPGDNIHPAWSSSEAKFSSFGCQTVSGAHSARNGHTGEWATFRACAGLSTSGEERRGHDYVYILLTGREAHYARFLNDSGKAAFPVENAAIRRLRFGSGSNGTETQRQPVRELQKALGLSGPDGALGPTTAQALVAKQKELRGFADGIVTPLLASDLGMFMGPPPQIDDAADPSTVGPLTRASGDPLPPAPGLVASTDGRADPDSLQISETAVFTFMLGNESFYAYQYFMPEGDTIGYGHLINSQDGDRFRDGLTEDEAFALFHEDMDFFVGVIRRSIEVPITQGQFDALASLTANVGHVPKSVRALINEEDFAAAAEQFRRFVKDVTGTVLPGLVRRRDMEAHLFLTGRYPNNSLSGSRVMSRQELQDRHLRQIERLFPDRLGEPHRSPTRDLQRHQAASAYKRMTGKTLPGAA